MIVDLDVMGGLSISEAKTIVDGWEVILRLSITVDHDEGKPEVIRRKTKDDHCQR